MSQDSSQLFYRFFISCSFIHPFFCETVFYIFTVLKYLHCFMKFKTIMQGVLISHDASHDKPRPSFRGCKIGKSVQTILLWIHYFSNCFHFLTEELHDAKCLLSFFEPLLFTLISLYPSYTGPLPYTKGSDRHSPHEPYKIQCRGDANLR